MVKITGEALYKEFESVGFTLGIDDDLNQYAGLASGDLEAEGDVESGGNTNYQAQVKGAPNLKEGTGDGTSEERPPELSENGPGPMPKGQAPGNSEGKK